MAQADGLDSKWAEMRAKQTGKSTRKADEISASCLCAGALLVGVDRWIKSAQEDSEYPVRYLP
jgi:hypothetical protein